MICIWWEFNSELGMGSGRDDMGTGAGVGS